MPILGADTVVGGKRSKLFTDGRPKSQANNTKSNTRHINSVYTANKVLEELYCSEPVDPDHENTHTYEQAITLKERPSPVGGESIDNETYVAGNSQKNNNVDSEDDWDNWDNPNRQLGTVDLEQRDAYHIDDIPIDTELPKSLANIIIKNEQPPTVRSALLQKAALEAKKNIVDISELDIKNQKVDATKKKDDVDFFADMMPVIEKQKIVTVVETQNFNKLDFIPADADETEDWGENWNE